MTYSPLETAGLDFSQEKMNELVNQRRLEDRVSRASVYVNRGLKYIQSYLYDYNISIKRDFRKNPLKVVLEINCSPEDIEEDLSTIPRKTKIVDVPKEVAETEQERQE